MTNINLNLNLNTTVNLNFSGINGNAYPARAYAQDDTTPGFGLNKRGLPNYQESQDSSDEEDVSDNNNQQKRRFFTKDQRTDSTK